MVAITDGIDPYEERFDPSDPYVNSATQDSIRAGVIVDALYWHDMGVASRIGFLATGGQSLLGLITTNTGGVLYYQGLSNPVSFTPFLNDLSKRLENQYELGFIVPGKNKPEIQSLKSEAGDAGGEAECGDPGSGAGREQIADFREKPQRFRESSHPIGVMASTVWKGYFSFGLISVPIKLYRRGS